MSDVLTGLLSAIYGTSTASTATTDPSMAILALRRAVTGETKGAAKEAESPAFKRQAEAFKKAIDKAPDIKSALRDPKILSVLMPAMGMPDVVSQPGLVQRALLADPKDTKGLLSRLTDTRWKDVATALDLGNKGLDALKDPELQAKLLKALASGNWRTSQDDVATGVSDALYFQDKAESAKDVYAILGDPVLRRVVTGALGLPDELALQTIEAQGRVVTTRLKLAKLQDSKEVKRLAERYVMNRAMAANGGQATSPLLSLFV